MRLMLVRHGETKWNRENRIVGHTEIGLNSTGHRQVALLARALSKEKVERIYSSPLRRAVETANAIAKQHGLDVVTDDALKEVDAGELDGITIEEVVRRYGNFWEEWAKGAGTLRMPGGETMGELQQRSWSAITRVVTDHPEGKVIIVSHTLTILSILTTALGMPLEDFRRLRLSLASVNTLDFKGRVTSLVSFNDTCHLMGM
jgi:broad specificity phosphatase PhoE